MSTDSSSGRFANDVETSNKTKEKMTKFLGAEDSENDSVEMVDEQSSAISQKKDSEEESSEDIPKNTDVEVITKRKKTLSALGYISFFCILPLALEPKSEFCKLHGKQGMVITIVFFLLQWFGTFNRFFWFLLFIVHVGLMAYGMYLAFKDEPKKIPMVGDVADKIEI